jgi:uncharacterized protein (DUF427 family)
MSELRYEKSGRWVRVKFGGEIIADSTEPMLVWYKGGLPAYYFQPEAIAQEVLSASSSAADDGLTYWDVTRNGVLAEAAAWSFGTESPLAGYTTFKWRAMEAWYEEGEEIFAHPRDPYHRVDVVASSRHVRVVVDGTTVAETSRPHLLFETTLPTRYYLPAEDVNMALLTPTSAHTLCPYKGQASYWSVKLNGQTHCNLVWGYPDPIPECPKIKGLLCFFNEKVDIYVDGKLQPRPQTAWS